MQIADGAADPGEDLLADLYRRRLPGDGALPLRPLLESLHRMDAEAVGRSTGRCGGLGTTVDEEPPAGSGGSGGTPVQLTP